MVGGTYSKICNSKKRSRDKVTRSYKCYATQCCSTRKSVACSERFIRLYHTRELTNFDKALSYKFMNPLDLSHDHYDDHMDSYVKRIAYMTIIYPVVMKLEQVNLKCAVKNSEMKEVADQV